MRRGTDIDALVAERDREREARYAARAAVAAEKAQGTSLERAKIAALKEVAAKNPGGSLPGFLATVSAKMGAKFQIERELDSNGVDIVDVPAFTEPVIAMPLTLYREPPRPLGAGCAAAELALYSPDTLSCICSVAGLRAFAVIALVCRAWRDAIDSKAREWGVLSYLKAVGGGYGKRKAQLDTPTWVCALPVRDNLLNLNDAQSLCVVDSCNYRLSNLRFDGTTIRIFARVGVESSVDPLGEVSQPSSICFDAGTNSAFVVATIGASDRRLLRYSLPHFKLIGASPEGAAASELDAPEGMTCCNGLVFVVDAARHRVVTFDASSLQCLGYSGGPSDRRTRWCHKGSGEPIFTSPHDICSHEGELFVSDTHNDRIQVLAAQHPARWIGVIGQSGHGPGMFTYPRGLAVARQLLYVCEERQVHSLPRSPRCRAISSRATAYPPHTATHTNHGTPRPCPVSAGSSAHSQRRASYDSPHTCCGWALWHML